MDREEILKWCRKYNDEEDQYNTTLEPRLGNKLRATKELTKEDLIEIVKWKFQGKTVGRRKIFIPMIEKENELEIKETVKKALNTNDEQLGIKQLMGRYGGVNGVGLALASVILTFYDAKNYGIFDIHAYDELFGTNKNTTKKLVRKYWVLFSIS